MPTMKDNDFAPLFQAVQTLNARMHKFEVRLSRQERKAKTVLRLYNRYYAQGVRRSGKEKNMIRVLAESYKNWQGHVKQGHVQRLSRMLTKVAAGKGCIVPTLTTAEFVKFRKWLKKDFRSLRA